jgi:hypothetical protein
VVPNPFCGVEHHTGGHPPVLQKPAALTQKNWKLQKQNASGWNPPAFCSLFNIPLGISFAHGA